MDPRRFYKLKTNFIIRTHTSESDDVLIESDTEVHRYTSQSQNSDSDISQDTESDSDWEGNTVRVDSNTIQHTHSQADEEDPGFAAPVELNDIRWRTAHTIVPIPPVD